MFCCCEQMKEAKRSRSPPKLCGKKSKKKQKAEGTQERSPPANQALPDVVPSDEPETPELEQEEVLPPPPRKQHSQVS